MLAKVLPLCLEEIRRCRPYFIGLLGERYGWIPDTIPEEVIQREPWVREHVQGRRSVTEFEILHGVLNAPEMAGHAFFYFRDPKFVDSVPEDRKQDFTTEDSEAAKKLKRLKDRIRGSDAAWNDNYPDEQPSELDREAAGLGEPGLQWPPSGDGSYSTAAESREK